MSINGNGKLYDSLKVFLLIERNTRNRFWENAVLQLKDSGIRVTLITVQKAGPLHQSLEAKGCSTLSLNCSNSANYPSAIIQLAKMIRKEQVNIIHACEPIPATIGGAANLLARRGKSIFHRQHCMFKGKPAIFSRIGSNITHLTMACSKSSALHASQIDGVPPSRTRVIYNATPELRHVSTEEIVSLKRKLGIPESSPIISMLAHLRPEKGHSTLIAALSLLNKSLPNPAHLVIIGSGGEEEKIRDQINNLNLSTVHLVGHQEDVALWFQLADVVAMPSFEEAFGISAIEAMACFRPLVASRVGGLTEVVEDNVSGLLVEPGNKEELANALYKIITTPSLASFLATNGFKRFQDKFTIEAMVNSWISCYKDLLNS
jgi:glycosyltransferase involved in cell wall biosynthesis